MITTEADIQAKDVKRLLMSVYKRYQAGLISEAQATKEAGLLLSVLTAIEVTDIESRLEGLAGLMKGEL